MTWRSALIGFGCSVAVLFPPPAGAADAQQDPGYRNPNAATRLERSARAIDSIETQSRVLRVALFNPALGTPMWLTFSEAQMRAERRAGPITSVVQRFFRDWGGALGLDQSGVTLSEVRRRSFIPSTHTRTLGRLNPYTLDPALGPPAPDRETGTGGEGTATCAELP